MPAEDLSGIETSHLTQFAEGYLLAGQAEKLGQTVDELVRRALDAETLAPKADEITRYLGALLGNPMLPEDIRLGLATSLASSGLLPNGR